MSPIYDMCTLHGHFPDRKLRWDSANLRFDDREANEWVRRTYRDGWEIEGL